LNNQTALTPNGLDKFLQISFVFKVDALSVKIGENLN